MEKSTEEITGTLAKIRFNQDGYMIGAIDTGNHSVIPVKGPMLKPELGLEYILFGSWDENPRWGRQFKFSDYRSRLPSSTTAIEEYLADHCRWVGAVIAAKITTAYGTEALTILKNDPGRVAREISGITPERAQEIAAKLRLIEREEALDLALRDLLSGTRIPKRTIAAIKDKWGEHSAEQIKANPFALIQEFNGIGFHSADKVAKKIGYDHLGAPRIDAGIMYTLEDAASGAGHTCLPISDLIGKAAEVLDVDAKLVEEREVVLIGTGELVLSLDRVFLRSLYEAEQVVAEKLKAMLGFAGNRVTGTVSTEGLMADQKEAIEKAVANGVFLLTGPPGTGKTFTIKAIINSFLTARISLAAPTGKAAKRMTEQTGREATTVHKLLGARPNDDGEFEFGFDGSNPIGADLIVLDEVSMMDMRLMASFLKAVSPSTRLILVGDCNQLPSVGPGNVLRHLIDSGTIPNVELTIIKRQDPGLIVLNCHAIKNGQDITVNNKSKDFFFLEREEPAEIQKTIVELVKDRLPASYGVNRVRDIQVITALREKGNLSVKVLNVLLQNELNPNPEIPGTKFRIGDKVIQLRNASVPHVAIPAAKKPEGSSVTFTTRKLDSDRPDMTTIANGDIGYILECDEKEKVFYVKFEAPEREVLIPMKENNLDLAYAITVHKFQGSESPIIVIPIHSSSGFLILQRPWLYTATSRAKNVCILVGQRKEIPAIIQRKSPQARYSRLSDYLKVQK